MSESAAEKKQHRISEIAVIVGAAGVIVKALLDFVRDGKAFSEILTSLDWWAWTVIGTCVFVAGLYVRFSKSSRLLKVEALRIDPDNPDHLIGRREKIEQLAHLCRDSFLVDLVGESGAGKSAMVRSGLVPALRDDETLLPVYMDTWGQDWELGPRTGLTDAVWAV